MEFVEIMEFIASFSALLLSLISLIWQIATNVKNLYVQLDDVFITEGQSGIRYSFRFSFINKSHRTISISGISLKYDEYTVPFDYEKTLVVRKINSDGEVLSTLLTREIPFRIDGLSTECGYFNVWNIPCADKVKNNETINIIIYTNSGKITKELKLPEIKTTSDIRYDRS